VLNKDAVVILPSDGVFPQPISFTRVSSREVTSRMLGLRSSMDVPFIPLPALSSPSLNKSDTNPDLKGLASDADDETSSIEDTINLMSVRTSPLDAGSR